MKMESVWVLKVCSYSEIWNSVVLDQMKSSVVIQRNRNKD